MDATKFLEQVGDRYDVIIVDFPDPNAPELAKLYSVLFYQQLRKRLNPRGLMVQQSTSPFWAKEAFLNIGRTIKASGFVALPYHDYVPSFGPWGFWIAADSAYVSQETLTQRARSQELLSVDKRYLTSAKWHSNLVFGKGALDSPNTDINTITSSRLHEYYLRGWQKTF